MAEMQFTGLNQVLELLGLYCPVRSLKEDF